jgi:hypothetical protein
MFSGGAALLAVRHAIAKKARTDRATATIRRRVIVFLPSSGLDPTSMKKFRHPGQS